MSPSSSPAGIRSRSPIAVDDLQPGMILADSVHDAQGRLLIPQGTELNERHLRAFQLWGILNVRVRGPENAEPESPPFAPEAIAEAEAAVRPRFRHNDPDHPLIAALLRVCIDREVRRRVEHGGGDA